jgi:hypothetical protein
MVTIPVSATSNFNIRTSNKAQIFADIAGYYVKPLYVEVYSNGSAHSGMASGVVSTSRTATGVYTVTFNRNVRHCAANATDEIWGSNRDVSPDVLSNTNANTVDIKVKDIADAYVDTDFFLSLTC